MDYHDLLDRDNIAFEIRKYFKSYKAKQLGRPYKPHPDHDTTKVWEAAADKCIELGSDPLSFVEAAFRYCNVKGKHNGPFPKHLGSKAMDRWCENFEKINTSGQEGSMYENDIASEMTTASVMCYSASTGRGEPLEEVLLSEIAPIRAYVRIFLMPTKSIIKKYKDEAQEEIINNPGLYGALQKLGMDMSLVFSK